MSELSEKLALKDEQDNRIHSLVLDLTRAGKLVWDRCRFGIYSYVTHMGEYTLKVLKSNHSSRITIYVSTPSAENDLHVDGKEVWYFLRGKTERPDRAQFIRELERKQ